jgi:hypothetical protein
MIAKSTTKVSKTKTGWILILSALLLLLGIYYMTFPDLIQWYAIERQPVKTKGIVIGRKTFHDIGSGVFITYRVDITDATGNSKSYTKSQNTRSGYAMNSEVPIEYAVSNPSYSRIEGEDPQLLPRLIITAFLTLVVGLLFYAGIVSIKSGTKQKRVLSETYPCPYCGAKLRTKSARQCRECKREWHDQAFIE